MFSQMKIVKPVSTILAPILLILATPLFSESGPSYRDSFEEPVMVTGRLLLSLTMPIPEADRDEILTNAALLEAEGMIVAVDGSSVVFADASPAGWLIKFGRARALAAADGSFVMNVEGVNATSGSIYHPSHEDDRAVGTFSRSDLVPQGQTPTPVVLSLPFDGPCGMTVGPDNPSHCQGTTTTTTASLIQNGPVLPNSTYPPSPRESACEILDGWISSNFSPLGSYFGSTCYNRVLAGACPNEGGFGFISEDICCFKNHRGRFCQELKPGDVELLDLPLNNTVVLDDVTTFTVHNNANWAETLVTPWLEKGIGGNMPAQSDYFDGEAGSIKHFDAVKLAAYSCKNNSPSDGADIYVADRVVSYKTPRCLTKAPASDAKDAYRIQTRDGLGEFLLTFRLDQSFLWQFEGSGEIFDLGQALELRGSVISEPEPIVDGKGCAGQHIHGAHPCTGIPDPDPMNCGHGIVTPLSPD